MRPSAETIWGAPRGYANKSYVAARDTSPGPVVIQAQVGADVRYVRRTERLGPGGVIVHAGGVLSASNETAGRVWKRGDLSIDRVVGVADAAPTGGVVLAVARQDLLLALDLVDGSEIWRFPNPGRHSLLGQGSVRLVEKSGRVLVLISPTYSTVIECVDLLAAPEDRTLWRHDFGASIDAGFGPVLIVDDLLGRGSDQVIVSSRTGSAYGEDDTEVASERLVLGRDDGKLYQAVLNLESGELLAEGSYRPDPGEYPAARPYGLLTTTGTPSPDVVLVSCQVEEYVAVTATRGGLTRRWGWFVEKDWPADEQELRPQSTSVADVMGDGRPRLVVGHWDRSWSTLVLDVLGDDATGDITRLPDRYFWGCADLDGDGVDELITSPATARRLPSLTVVDVIDARTSATIATERDVRLVTTGDDEMPVSRAFHAERDGAATLRRGDGRLGLVLVAGDRRGSWWSPQRGGEATTRELWNRPIRRVDDRPGGATITDDAGTVLVLDPDLQVQATVTALGRRSVPLLWKPRELELVAADGAGRIAGWGPGSTDPSWSVAGTRAALHRDQYGDHRLATAEPLDAATRVTLYRRQGHGPVAEWGVVLDSVVDSITGFGDDPLFLIGERLGPHTLRSRVLDADGVELWRDERRGPHASEPLAASDASLGPIVAYDDHGVLTVRQARTGAVMLEVDWTAAYTTPVLASVDDRAVIIRADGTHGLESIDLAGNTLWRRGYDLLDLHPGASALTEVDGETAIAVGRRDGTLDMVSVRDGALLASHLLGDQALPRPILGLGEWVVAGLLTGEVRAMEPLTGRIVWHIGGDTGVEALAGYSDDTDAALAISFADGSIRVIELKPDEGATASPVRRASSSKGR